MNLTEVNCYSCGSKEHKYYDSENGFNLVKCSNCGLLYVNPRPSSEDISKSMLTGEHSGDSTIYLTGRYHKSYIKKYLQILSDFFPEEKSELSHKKWLDIGCGFGEFLLALNLYSKDEIIAKGSEPNEAKIRFAHTKNLDVSFIDIDNHFEKYDFISLLNVYSHLPDPVEYISNLKKNLNSNGEIFLQTGHSCHLPVKLHSRPYSLPDHLSFANQEIIENIFKKLGFEIVNIIIYSKRKSRYSFDVIGFIKGVVKIMLRKRKSFRGFIPRYPYQDMFVRCRLIN
jgi:SAM-dependent methyltransferase